MELRNEWEKLRRDYVENVHREIHNLRERYDAAENDLLPSYKILKRLIKHATSDRVLERCQVPDHKYSILNPEKNKHGE